MVIIENKVSLWIGKSMSQKSMEKFIHISYTKSGDIKPSKFMRDFNLNYYDEDFKESEYFEETVTTFSDLLNGFSYDDVIIKNYIDLFGNNNFNFDANAALLLYNFEYSKDLLKNEDKKNKFVFIGSVYYR